MKIALISDVHSNLEALEEVLRDIEKEGVEKIHFLGDAVGYGTDPNKCIKLISKHCDIKLLGNHDYASLGLISMDGFNKIAKTSVEWTQTKLKKKSIEKLADFELISTFLDYSLVHASPGTPDNWDYVLSAEQAHEQFSQFSQSICFIGHSHIPTVYIEETDGTVSSQVCGSLELIKDLRYIINIGSVGQPRDNDPRACYLKVDTESSKIEYRRVDYNIDKTQAKMRKAMFPDFLVERLAVGR
ncbi:MAG: metallophosphoesterase family protein [candidate division Zixibacteria bacterium]|nr:metallophosphoesterase family protein [candidate division Zixibacteria bacterium]